MRNQVMWIVRAALAVVVASASLPASAWLLPMLDQSNEDINPVLIAPDPSEDSELYRDEGTDPVDASPNPETVPIGDGGSTGSDLTEEQQRRLEELYADWDGDTFESIRPTKIVPTSVPLPGQWDGEATAIVEIQVTLVAGQTVTFETTDLSQRADPVLHLLNPPIVPIVTAQIVPTDPSQKLPDPPPPPPFEAAHNDDGAGGLAAKIVFTPELTGTYVLVLRARSSQSGGSCRILRDGMPIGGDYEFGGFVHVAKTLRRFEQLRTVPVQGGPTREQVMYVTGSDGISLSRRAPAGPHGSAIFTTNDFVDNATVIVGVTDPQAAGPVRLVRNDPYYGDADGDGLGDGLEAEIGTCSTDTEVAGGFDCSMATDPRDSDGDGLRDDIELFGAIDKGPYQLLPRWGADPRHKDVFVEVDYWIRSFGEIPQFARPAELRVFADAYADVESANTPWVLFSGATLLNPDARPGIAFHFDTGVNPPSQFPADLTLYGDWGGHNDVDLGCGMDCSQEDIQPAWKNQLDRVRWGIFHHALSYPSGGGQCGSGQTTCAWPIDNGALAAHEFAHTIGLGHSGRYDAHPADANCKPNYPSLMSYAYLHQGHRGFSRGQRESLNSAMLSERFAVPDPDSPEGTTYLNDLERKFGYNVDFASGHVDWNRDGVFSEGPVAAWANNNGSGCEITRYNQTNFENERSERSPSLARLAGDTFVFYVNGDKKLAYVATDSNFQCGELRNPGCDDTQWAGALVGGDWNHDIHAVDVHRVYDDSEMLLAVYLDDKGKLHEVSIRPGATWNSISVPLRGDNPNPIPIAEDATGEPSLTGSGLTLRLAYRGASGNARILVRVSGTGWGADTVIRDMSGMPIPINRDSSPAILEVGVGGGLGGVLGGGRIVWGAFPTAGSLLLYELDTAGRVRNQFDQLATRAQGRPALAWEPLPGNGGLPGRVHLGYLLRNTSMPWERDLQYAITVGIRQADGSVRAELGVDGDFDNTWLAGYGIDFFREEGVDGHVRAAFSRARAREDDSPTGTPHEDDARIQFRPFGDGIFDVEMRDENDWAVFRDSMCGMLADDGDYDIDCPK